MNLLPYAQEYRRYLRERIVPFWQNFSIDTQFGGYHCVLSAKGEVITSDKWIEWHGQQSSAFLYFYLSENQPIFLQSAQQGADFLLRYAFDEKGTFSEVVDTTGRKLTDVSDARPEAAAVVAWASIAPLIEASNYAEIAKKTFLRAFRHREKRLQKQIEEVSNGRQLKNISELSAVAKALWAVRESLGEKNFKEKAEALLNELMKHFWEPRAGILLENVFSEGGFSDCLQGRRIHPGRAFEAFNAFYDITKILNKRRIRQQLAEHIAYLTDTTWDEAYGGYFHWLDVKSLPPSQPDAYFKYAWVQLEATTAILMAYQVLQDRELLRKWLRVHDYTWQHFPDNTPEGEWIEVLSRHGEPLFSLKATPAKSAYPVVKNLLDSAAILEQIQSSF
ncbi:MAG: AGE family epimerase/isomerase [Runella sp.]